MESQRRGRPKGTTTIEVCLRDGKRMSDEAFARLYADDGLWHHIAKCAVTAARGNADLETLVRSDAWLRICTMEERLPIEDYKREAQREVWASAKRHQRSGVAMHMGASMTSTGIGKNEDSAKLMAPRYHSAWRCRDQRITRS